MNEKKLKKTKKEYEEDEDDEDEEEEEDEESENNYKVDGFVVADKEAYEEDEEDEEEDVASKGDKMEIESEDSLMKSDLEVVPDNKKKKKLKKAKKDLEPIKKKAINYKDQDMADFIHEDEMFDEEEREIDHMRKVKNIASSIPHQIFSLPESENVKIEPKATKISKIYSCEELEEEFATPFDNKIKVLDYPERLLLKYKEEELTKLATTIDQEADWIFEKLKIQLSSIESIQNVRKKIAMVLEFYKKEFIDIPYIVTYKKFIFEPELTSNDIWRLFELDNEWQVLNEYKQTVLKQFKTIKAFLGEKKAEFMEKRNIESAKSIEELRDMEVFIYFNQEIYSEEINKMKEEEMKNGNNEIEVFRPVKKSLVSDAKKNKIDDYTKKFAITAHDLAINLELILKNENSSQLIPAPQPLETPPILAEQYLNEEMDKEIKIMTQACDFLALEMGSYPFIRQYVWNNLKTNCFLSTEPTPQGKIELNVFNPSFRTKRILKKPINLFTNDLYLDIVENEEKGLIKSSITIFENEEDFKEITNRISTAYMPNVKGDEENEIKKGWKIMRDEAIRILIKKVLMNQFLPEIRAELLKKAENYVINECGNSFFNLLSTGPYRKHCNENNDNDEIFKDNELPRVMSFVYDQNKYVYCVILSKNGEVLDHYIFSYLANRPLRTQKPEEKQNFYDDQAKCKSLIQQHKPDLIVIGANDLKCRYLKDQIIACEPDMMKPDEGNASIWVTFGDLAIPRIYSNSQVSEKSFPNYNIYLKQTVSLGRLKQNPLEEVLQLWHEDINKNFCLKLSLHPLQRAVNQTKLAKMLEMKAIQMVNSIGVDINRILNFSHLKSSLSFVSGLGPRKAQHLLEKIAQDNRLSLRAELLARKIVGRKVFFNCNGFIKIKTPILSNVSRYDLLDMTRIPIDIYPLANHLIRSALDDENIKDSVDSVEIILRDPKKLEILDLNEYIRKQSENSNANSIFMLRFMIQLIKTELNAPFADPRKEHKDLTPSEIFLLLIGDENFKVGHMTIAKVIKVDEQHVKCRLTNDLEATVWIKDIFEDNEKSSNAEMKNRYKEGSSFEARIKAINENNFKIDLATKPSIMVNHKQFMNVNELDYFDLKEEDWINQRYQQESKEEHHRYIPRKIIHEKFKNVSCQACLEILRNKEIGDCLFRPSSRGINNLTLTWKFYKHIYCHIDIIEEDKLPGSVISSKLAIANEVYSSLNEIINRYVNPCAQYVKEAIQSRKFIHCDTLFSFEKKLKADKAKDSTIIHYNFTILRDYPLYIILGYTPKLNSVITEFIKVKPNGFHFHLEYFSDLDDIITFFKRKYGTDQYSDYVRKIKPPAIEYHRPIEKEYSKDYSNDPSSGNDYGVVQSHGSGSLADRSSTNPYLKNKRSRSPNADDNRRGLSGNDWSFDNKDKGAFDDAWGKDDKKESNRQKGCFNCGEEGHIFRDCLNRGRDRNDTSGGERKRNCFNCGEEGHMSKDCPNPRKDRMEHMSERDRDHGRDKDRDKDRKKTCFTCGEEGHMSFECTHPKKERSDKQGGGIGERKKTCFNCWEEGHMSKDCPNPRKEKTLVERNRSLGYNNRTRPGRGEYSSMHKDEDYNYNSNKNSSNQDNNWGNQNESTAWNIPNNQADESKDNKGWDNQNESGNDNGW